MAQRCPLRAASIVTALTTAAVVVVGVLGYQAAASAPDTLTQARKDSPHRAPKKHPERAARRTRRPLRPRSPRRPARAGGSSTRSMPSGSGWSARGQGAAYVHGRAEHGEPAAGHLHGQLAVGSVTGSDGAAIEHVVRFATVGSVTIGFSAAVDGSSRPRTRRRRPAVSVSRGPTARRCGTSRCRAPRSSWSPDRAAPGRPVLSPLRATPRRGPRWTPPGGPGLLLRLRLVRRLRGPALTGFLGGVGGRGNGAGRGARRQQFIHGRRLVPHRRPGRRDGVPPHPSGEEEGWWADMDASRGSWDERQKLGLLLRLT